MRQKVTLINNLIITGLYLLFGVIGFKFAALPGYASIIFPSAGIAAAVAICFGTRLLPGVWLGSFLLNVWLAFEQGNITQISSLIAFLIAFGASLQAWIASLILNPDAQDNEKSLTDYYEIARFFILVGPIACLTAASWGHLILYIFGVVNIEQLISSWLNWWIGDLVGVLIMTPLSMIAILHKHRLWHDRVRKVGVPVVLGMIIIITLFSYVRQNEVDRFDHQMAQRIDVLTTEVQSRFTAASDTTKLISNLLKFSPELSYDEFKVFANSILESHPEVYALSWNPYIKPADRSEFEQNLAKKLGFSELKIKQKNLEGKMVIADNGSQWYVPVAYIAPEKPNLNAIGYDIASETIRRSAIKQASMTEQLAITAPIHLVQDSNFQSSILMLNPVSNGKGFGVAVVHIKDLLKPILSNLDSRIELVLEDKHVISDDRDPKVLFASHSMLDLSSIEANRVWQTEIEVGGRIWEIYLIPSLEYFNSNQSILAWQTMILGLVLLVMLQVLLLNITGQHYRNTRFIEQQNKELILTDERLKLSQRYGGIGTWEANFNTYDQTWSDVITEQLGFPSLAQPRWNDFLSIIHHQDRDRVEKSIIEHLNNYVGIKIDYRIIDTEDNIRWMQLRAQATTDQNDLSSKMVGTIQEITAEKNAQEQLRLTARVFTDSHEGINITDANGLIVDVNPAFCGITGYSREELIGNNPNILSSGNQSREFYNEMWKQVLEQGYWSGEVWNRNKNGELYAAQLSIAALPDDDGITTNYIGLTRDITQQKHQQEKLNLIAHYDVLTKLPNRLLFADRFNQAVLHNQRYDKKLVVAFLDLDHFKPLNNKYGHETGDQILIEVANRITSTLRGLDTVSRQGGDEFALLLNDVNSIEDAEKRLERIHHAISKPYVFNDQTFTVSSSSGFTLYPDDDGDIDTLLRHADQAMYVAKQSGRGQYKFFDAEKDQAHLHRFHRLSEIETALNNNEFDLYYQPKVNMVTGDILGAEGLIRWVHPEKGLISPFDFLPVIESTDLEIKVGFWVLQQGVKQLATLHKQGHMISVSVNISSNYLLSQNFIFDLEQALTPYPNLDSSYLELEILESSALGELSQVQKTLITCRDKFGVAFALDDFGTGYSTLTHLRSLPAQTIKIDQSFVRNMLSEHDDFTIVDSVISLGKSFSRHLIAEGVETVEHGLMLILMGCDVAQGYSIARPMSVKIFSDWLNQYEPNLDWLSSGEKQLSLKDTELEIFHLIHQDWKDRYVGSILSQPWQHAAWPKIDSNKCHCGIWLQQARNKKMLKSDTLDQIDSAHQHVHDIAKKLKENYKQGQVAKAQDGIAEFEAAHARLAELTVKHINLEN